MSIATYKSQLEQVQLALAASQEDENKLELTQLASGMDLKTSRNSSKWQSKYIQSMSKIWTSTKLDK